MRFGVLGSLLVLDETGQEIVVPAGRLRILLAALLLRANHVVSLDELVAALWDGQGPDGAVRTVRVHMTRLRRTLGPASGRLVTRAPGYLVRVEDGELDEQVFETLCSAAGAAAREQRWARARELLTEALGLWRGTPLADVPAELLREQFVPRMERSRLQALEDCVELHVRKQLHTKGILLTSSLLMGSMNLTYNGMVINDEWVEFSLDSQDLARTKLEFMQYMEVR